MNQLAAADLGLKKLLALSALVSYEFSLDIPPRESYRDLFRRSYAVLEKDRIVPPSVLVLIFGLASYLQLEDRGRLYEHSRRAYATIPSREVRKNVRSLWVAVIDALVASSQGDIEVALRHTQAIHAGLRSSRFVKQTFLGLITTADLLAALLLPTHTARIARAWTIAKISSTAARKNQATCTTPPAYWISRRLPSATRAARRLRIVRRLFPSVKP